MPKPVAPTDEQIKAMPLIIMHGMRCHTTLLEAPTMKAMYRLLAEYTKRGWMLGKKPAVQMGKRGPLYKAVYYPELYLTAAPQKVLVVYDYSPDTRETVKLSEEKFDLEPRNADGDRICCMCGSVLNEAEHCERCD